MSIAVSDGDGSDGNSETEADSNAEDLPRTTLLRSQEIAPTLKRSRIATDNETEDDEMVRSLFGLMVHVAQIILSAYRFCAHRDLIELETSVSYFVKIRERTLIRVYFSVVTYAKVACTQFCLLSLHYCVTNFPM